jgi:N6-L-threonylcarbamoyladenine synthase
MIVLSVESSCDETSVSITQDGKLVLSNIVASQISIHKEFGGVVPEVASRNHLKIIHTCFDLAIKEAKITIKDIDLVAVTKGPGLVGSLLIGIDAALAFSYANHIPVIGVNHLIAHLYASFIENDVVFPALGLLVSGGHTELILLKDHFDFLLLGSTLDDAVGETYDKIGRALSFSYPGGIELDKRAQNGEDLYKYKRVMLPEQMYNFSFSGLKRAVIDHKAGLDKTNTPYRIEDIASSLQHSVMDTIFAKVDYALKQNNLDRLVIAGGVAANSELRKRAAKLNNIKVYIPSLKYCGDNAAMIGICGYYQYKKYSWDHNYIIKAQSRLDI